MTRIRPRTYTKDVLFGSWQALMRLLLAFVFAMVTMSRACADVTLIPTANNPVVWVQLRSGSITVHTWDRAEVSIDADPTVQWRHVDASKVDPRLLQQITLWSYTVALPDGNVTLPAETFMLPPLQGDMHDAVLARGAGNVTITIPAGSALVTANVRQGDVSIDNYRNGLFIMHVGRGSVHLANVSGTGAIQVIDGPISALDSDFTRIRARTVQGSIAFERCNSKQIEATSVVGSVLYDNGTFEPGLARFESDRGNVALGVASGAVQINAHSETGDVHSGFGSDARVTQNGTSARAVVGAGGPVVTATSNGGTVLFYKGALRENQKLQNVPAARTILQHTRRHPPFFPRFGRPPR